MTLKDDALAAWRKRSQALAQDRAAEEYARNAEERARSQERQEREERGRAVLTSMFGGEWRVWEAVVAGLTAVYYQREDPSPKLKLAVGDKDGKVYWPMLYVQDGHRLWVGTCEIRDLADLGRALAEGWPQRG